MTQPGLRDCRPRDRPHVPAATPRTAHPRPHVASPTQHCRAAAPNATALRWWERTPGWSTTSSRRSRDRSSSGSAPADDRPDGTRPRRHPGPTFDPLRQRSQRQRAPPASGRQSMSYRTVVCPTRRHEVRRGTPGCRASDEPACTRPGRSHQVRVGAGRAVGLVGGLSVVGVAPGDSRAHPFGGPVASPGARPGARIDRAGAFFVRTEQVRRLSSKSTASTWCPSSTRERGIF